MGTIIERIPVVSMLNDSVHRLFPIADDHAETYHKLSGIWIAAGAIATEQTAEWIEKVPPATSPALFAGTVAVAAIPTAAATFFWQRGWKSKGE
jgi:hypothetical protein